MSHQCLRVWFVSCLITLFSPAGSWLLHWLFLVVKSGGRSPVAVRGPLTAMASFVAEHGL